MRAALWVCLGTAACVSVDDDATRRDNTAPVAMLKAPVVAGLGRAARFDASDSFDGDGDELTYTFQFNDGSEPISGKDALVTHVFEVEALYEVVLRVTDSQGGLSIAAQDVSITRNFPDPPDFCGADYGCMVGDACEAGLCYSAGGTME